MPNFTYKDLSKPTQNTYRMYIQAGKKAKLHTENKRKNMKLTFARFGIAAQVLDKNDFQMFVSVFYLKGRKQNMMSDKAASVLKAFGNKAAGNNPEVVGFDDTKETGLFIVDDKGKVSEKTLNIWLALFDKLELKTWDDFKLHGVPTEEIILSDAFLKIKASAISEVKNNTNHDETVETFTTDIQAILVKAQKGDDARDTKKAKAKDKKSTS